MINKNHFVPSATGLGGAARRAAMALLVTLLTTATAWAGKVNLTENTGVDEDTAERWYINLPTTGNDTLNLTGDGPTAFKIYDDGGANPYSNDCSGAIIVIAPEGWVVQLSGTITSERNYDVLTVFDGDIASGTKLIDAMSSTSSGAETDINPVTSTGRIMTIYFYSDNLSRYLGLDLTVKIYNPTEAYAITLDNPATGGSLAASVGGYSVTSANVNDVVTLTATPESGYLLSGISVVDANGKPVALVWDGSFKNTATFVMPVSPVTITPTFTDTWTADGGLCVNVPKTGTASVTIPAGIPSFKVYDDGGPTGKYSSYCKGTLVLTAPDGYMLQLSGNITTERSFDNLSVFQGSTTSGTILLDSATSANNNARTDIPTVISTEQSMTLFFQSDGYMRCDGLDLTATLISTSIDYDITNVSATGGTLEVRVGDKIATTAKVNETVTLTATPESGYLLSNISIGGANVNLNWDIWTNTATFVMPPSAVTITPSFTDTWTASGGLFIDMPKTESKSVTIPTGVESFKVYDNGGGWGNYSNYCDGSLTLNAPEGYVLQLSGSIKSERYWDNLTVYDGSSTWNPALIDAVSSTTTGYRVNIPVVNSTGQSITLRFSSNFSGNYDGLDLMVKLVDTSSEFDITNVSATGGSLAVSVGGESATTAKVNDVVTLTATPDTKYLLSGISIVDANGTPVRVAWEGSFNNTAAFTMPATAVTITPTFTDTWTAAGGVCVNMPKTGTASVTIPAGVESFKVYDDGGATGNYSNNCYSTLNLTVPDGYQIRLSGKITTEQPWDMLTVYDGSGSTLISGVSSTYSGTETSIPTVTSTDKSMTLFFYSTYSGNYAGLNLQADVLVKNVLTLANGSDNSAAIATAAASHKQYQVTLSDRTLYKDGKWNTICLPFDVTLSGSALAGAIVKKLDATSSNLSSDGTLTLNFVAETTTMKAGTPYLIRWTSGDNLVNPLFTGVTIDADASTSVNFDGGAFVGTYSPVAFAANTKSILFIGGENKIYWPNADMTLRSCRAYFDLGSNEARRFVLHFDEENEVSGITNTNRTNDTNEAGAWFTLDGRRLSQKPTKPGLYINKGQKIAIK